MRRYRRGKGGENAATPQAKEGHRGGSRIVGIAATLIFGALMAFAVVTALGSEEMVKGHVQLKAIVALPIAIFLAGALLGGLWIRDRRARRSQLETHAEITTLRKAAHVDSLTGLGNHRAFEEDLLRALEPGWGSAGPVCLMSLDMHGLKSTNDTLGHQAGDERIRNVASALREVVGNDGSANRVGGDEFAVVLTNKHGWAGYEIALRLDDRLGNDSDAPEVSVGIAESRKGDRKDDLLARADRALISAKSNGRLAVVYSGDLKPDETNGVLNPGEEHDRAVLAAGLARAVDAKDAFTRGHSETVSTLCVMLAEQIGFNAEHTSKLRMAGLLHDVGKVGVPDAILSKPGKLTAEEFAVIQKHPELGASIALAAELDEEAVWILHHHERIDGRGYPSGLPAEEIPVESQIILVCDAYEALISDRPYRAGRSRDAALAEIERHAGTHFDPTCVAALRSALDASNAQQNANGGHESAAHDHAPAAEASTGGPPMPDQHAEPQAFPDANGGPPVAEPYEEPEIAVQANGATGEEPVAALYEEPRITRHTNGAPRSANNQDALEAASEQAPAADARVAELDLLADRARERLSLLIGLRDARRTQPQGGGDAGDRELTAPLGDRSR